jgi:hypothetical protein
MKNRRSFLSAVVTLGLLILSMSSLALGQGRDHPRDPEFPGRINNERYDRDRLREAVRRLVNHSRNFQTAIDNSLDRSKLDGTRREDRINYQAQNLRNASVELRDKLGDARNLDRSANEARRALEVGSRLDNFVSRGTVDLRSRAFWDQIRGDLRVISTAYGFRTGEFLNNNGR